MSLVVNFDVRQDEEIIGVQPVQFGPAQFTFANSTQAAKRIITLTTTKWHTLDVVELTAPYRWIFVNLSADYEINIGFGQAANITLPAQEPAFWPGSDIPFARAVGGSARLLYWIIQQT